MEQYFMYTKAHHFGDKDKADQALSLSDPVDIKRLCSRPKHWNRSKWELEGPQKIRIGLLAKFTQNDHLKQKLLSSADLILAECSRSDYFWGIAMDISSDNLLQRPWAGRNVLGELLMSVRSEIRTAELETTPVQTDDESDIQENSADYADDITDVSTDADDIAEDIPDDTGHTDDTMVVDDETATS
jgi:ribA/ribD-fused uncharacterized protein